MASGPITSWQIDGETVETVADFIFLGSKITIYSDYISLQRGDQLMEKWKTAINWLWAPCSTGLRITILGSSPMDESAESR